MLENNNKNVRANLCLKSKPVEMHVLIYAWKQQQKCTRQFKVEEQNWKIHVLIYA